MTVTTAGDPPNALGTDGPEPYAPMVWDSTLPKANSVIASTYANATTPKDQYTEASKLNTMIIEQNHQTFDTLHSITSPAAMLVQVTGTCQLRVIFGLAKYVANPLASDMSLHGLYFAIGEDLTSPTDTPLAVHLPDDVLKTNQVQIPTDQAFEDMLGTKSAAQSNCHLDTEQWFKVSTATTRATLAKAVPIPLYLAYDACTSDIAAHVLWERCKVELEALPEGEDDAILRTIMAFCKATHTKVGGASTKTVALPPQQLNQRLCEDAKRWIKARAKSICPPLTSTPSLVSSPQQGAPLPVHQSDMTATILAQILAQVQAQAGRGVPDIDRESKTDDPQDLIYKKFGIRGADMDVYLTQCGLTAGQEEELPKWKSEMAAPKLSEDGKDRVAKRMLALRFYEDHIVLPHPTIIKMIRKGRFTGESSATATAVMTGLTPYMLVDLTESEVNQAREYDQTLSLATSTTPADIKKQQSKKAVLPTSFQALVDTLRRFTNLVMAIYGASCPFFTQLTKLIRNMMKMDTAAKQAMDRQTIAAVMWVVYKQTRRFTDGEIAATTDTDLNWLDLQQHIFTAKAIHRTDIPLGINGIQLPPPPAEKKRDKPDGPPPANWDRDVNQKYTVHPRVASQIVAKLPNKYPLRVVLERKKITKDFFGIKNLCSQAALFGKCRNRGCPKDHNVDHINDAAVDTALAHLAPVFASIENEGKKPH